MNTNLGVQHPAIDGPSTRSVVRFGQTLFFLVMLVALFACGCASDRSSPFADGDPYRGQLAISDVHSFLYAEPGTQAQIPQVRGFLRNLGHQTLIMVEITLSFKDRRNRVIFEETAYPVYVSSLSNPTRQQIAGTRPADQVRLQISCLSERLATRPGRSSRDEGCGRQFVELPATAINLAAWSVLWFSTSGSDGIVKSAPAIPVHTANHTEKRL